MSSVKVAVRVRPFNKRELNLKCGNIIQMNGRRTCIKNPKCVNGEEASKDFTFDHSYWSFNLDDAHFASQSVVFQDLGEGIVSDAIDGYNSCIFAYGQTGSGKTYSMMGDDNSQGLIPRICERIFQRMDTLKNNSNSFSYKTEISYLEIYNEHVRDLLVEDEFDINGNTKHCLKVREHPKYGPYVENLSKHLVYSYQDILQLMSKGNKNRTTASTNMNDVSSRSHAIFTILFSKASYVANNPYETVSKINLVDLAGSERANSTNAQGQRLIEGSHINKSLVTLGNVISSLAENCKKNKKKTLFIPYRDSTLTWLLKDSLGGNSKTVMIATISPADVNYAETLNTLRYANRAKNIVNKPQINEDPNTKLIRELREEIDRLTSMINQNPRVHERLHENQVKVRELTAEWMSKWDEIKTILSEKHSIALRKSGEAGVVLDSDRPHLIVCVDDDVLSTGVTLYQLNEGNTYIGTSSAERRQDIVLNKGTDVESEHCYITWNVEDHTVTLHPINSSLCFVNNCPCDGPVVLHQGSLVVLGENNMFRFSNPMEVKHLLQQSNDLNSVDISQLNRNHLIGSTSYDSLYNSISSLNKKPSITAGNSESEKTTTDCNAGDKVGQCLNELEFIKSFLIEFKNNLPYNPEMKGRNESELLLESLLKVGAEKQISKENLLQLLSLITSNPENESKTVSNVTEKIIFRINNYLTDKIAEITKNKGISPYSSEIEKAELDLSGDDSQLLELSKEIDSHLTDLKSHVFNLSIDDQSECCCENMPNHSNSSLDSSTLNGNILDELVEAEVQRRLRLLESPTAFSTPKRQLELSLDLINGNLCEELDEIIIYVSSFHLQLQPEEHVLFEVQININGDMWTVYRRYRCFLQLKKDIAQQYGRYIQMPYFPPRFLFNKNRDCKALEMRRRFLENFLQRVLDSCKALPKCPLNHHSLGVEHLTRDCLYRFNSFFRVNTFSDKETW